MEVVTLPRLANHDHPSNTSQVVGRFQLWRPGSNHYPRCLIARRDKAQSRAFVWGGRGDGRLCGACKVWACSAYTLDNVERIFTVVLTMD